MKLSTGINKWGSAVLGVMCMFLVANLVTQYRSMQPGHAPEHTGLFAAPHAPAGKNTSNPADDLARYDPTVHFDVLKALDSRPLPDEDRNPFEFVGGAAPPPPQALAPAAKPVPPPPPPPPPLKVVGYNDLPGGQKEVMITLNDDLNVVHEGDMIGTKYKVLSVNSTKVIVEDESTHEKIELAVPQ